MLCSSLFLHVGTSLLNSLPFGSGSGPLFIEQLECSGSELNLMDCMEVTLRRETCTHADDVSIQCIGEQ